MVTLQELCTGKGWSQQVFSKRTLEKPACCVPVQCSQRHDPLRELGRVELAKVHAARALVR